VAPLHHGWIESVSLGSGGFTFADGTPTAEPGTGSNLYIQLGLAHINITSHLTQRFQPMVQYEAGTTVELSTSGSAGDCAASSDSFDQASFEFTQITYNALGSISSYALEFECFPTATSAGTSAVVGALANGVVPTTPHGGYYSFEADGAISGFGNDNFLAYLGDLSATTLNSPIVGMATTADDGGYWLVASDGGIFAYGDAGFYGSAGNLVLNRPIVGMAATPDGKGYWLVASDGGIFAYGDATFHGSMGGKHLNRPIVGMAPSPAGGYWLVASDGGIFAFGNAPFYGSTGNIVLNRPVVGMTPTPSGHGYWFVASDGGVFNYGDASFHGSAGSLVLNEPVVGMLATQSGNGYWLVASDGGIFTYNAPFEGSLGGLGIPDVAGLAS
jgi:hypothetical protein